MYRDDDCSILFNNKIFKGNNQGGLKTPWYTSTMWLYAALKKMV